MYRVDNRALARKLRKLALPDSESNGIAEDSQFQTPSPIPDGPVFYR
jgi:hypothetical protein